MANCWALQRRPSMIRGNLDTFSNEALTATGGLGGGLGSTRYVMARMDLLDTRKKNAKLALWCCFQNLLFYYDQESASKPTGVIFLEGCYTERILSTSNRSGDAPASNGNDNVSDKLVWNTRLLFEDDTNTHLFKCKIAVCSNKIDEREHMVICSILSMVTRAFGKMWPIKTLAILTRA